MRIFRVANGSLLSWVVVLGFIIGWMNTVEAEIIRVEYQALAETVVGQPFGLTVPLDTPVNGYFQYNTATPDSDVSTNHGIYVHASGGGFVADFLGHRVSGSVTPTWEVSTADTLRIYDGPRSTGLQGGIMSFDGTPSGQIQLFFAVTPQNSGLLPNDSLPNPWPAFNFGSLGDPHTFTLSSTTNTSNTMLLQITNLEVTTIASPSPVAIGSELTYSITVTNAGQLMATGVTLTNILPAEVSFVSASGNCTNSAGIVSCDVGMIDTGGVATATITVTANTRGLATNVVTVGETETDIDPSDNIVTTITSIQPVPPVALCANVTTNAGGDCMADVPATAVDNGSFDPDGTIVSRTLTPAGPYPVGATPVTLTVTDNQGASNTCSATITVVTNQPDLTLTAELASTTCTATTRGVTCILDGSLTLINHDAAYAVAGFKITTSCATKTVRCKLTGTLTWQQFSLGCTPASTLGVYLSDDTTFDARDVLLQRLLVAKFKKPFESGKPTKLTGKVPKGMNLSGKFLIFVLDDIQAVAETDETNNASTVGPLP
jgi:uncharacterized repeat protein (TIGR01451 family)